MNSSSEILISVELRFLKGFLNGSKRVEFRRKRLNVHPGTRTWVYGKSPYAKIGAACIIKSIEVGSLNRIWDEFSSVAGLSKQEFREYFEGCPEAHVLVFDKIYALSQPVALTELRKQFRNFHPPQFFKRLCGGSAELSFLEKRLPD